MSLFLLRPSQKIWILYNKTKISKRQTTNRSKGKLFLNLRNTTQQFLLQSYTIANESVHLLVFGVPKINLQNEMKKTFQRFGKTEFVKNVTDEIAQDSKFLKQSNSMLIF